MHFIVGNSKKSRLLILKSNLVAGGHQIQIWVALKRLWKPLI